MNSKAIKPLDIIVVGAGIAGCAAALALSLSGHRVHVIETQDDLNEFGAGIQISPSSVRILCSWGLNDAFKPYVHLPSENLYKRFDTGETLGAIPSNKNNFREDLLGSPTWQIHRPDYQRVLADAMRKLGAHVTFSARVSRCNIDAGSVELVDGRKFEADLIVGADGIRSKVRTFMPQNSHIQPLAFSEYIYRALLPRRAVMTKPRLAELMKAGMRPGARTAETLTWLGPQRWLLVYPISGGELLNIAMPCRRDSEAPLGKFNAPGDPEEMREVYSDFEPVVQELLSLVTTCAKWTMAYIPLLDTYVAGKVALVGDAAHAMPAHVSMGANSAIEDAAVLAECLQYPNALRSYQAIRKPRIDRAWEISFEAARIIAATDGVSQEENFARWRVLTSKYVKELDLDREERRRQYAKIEADMFAKYGTKELEKWLYGYDAVGEAQAYLAKELASG